MKQELDELLCAKYPLIFKDRNAPMTQTAMCWGFDCGDGWFTIIDTLCGLLTNKYDQAKERYEELINLADEYVTAAFEIFNRLSNLGYKVINWGDSF